MSPANFVMTRVYLDPEQRAALERKAREEKAEIADLIRRAIDVYIQTGVTREDFELLDAASLAAKADLDATIADLDSINAMIRGLKKDIHDSRARAARGEVI